MNMNATSVYLRVFFGAKPLRSTELDSLAGRMGVLDRLSSDPLDRYFVTDARSVTAVSLGNKIVFGRSYFDRLSEDERLAVGAHELAHKLEHGNRRANMVWSTLAASSVLMALIFLAFHSLLLTESAFCLSFLGVMRIRSSREVEKGKLQEIRCDGLAASFVGPEPMIGSLRLAESMSTETSKRNLWRRFGRVSASATEERIRAINCIRPKPT